MMCAENLLDGDLELPPSKRPIAGERLFRGDLPDFENNACPHWHADGLHWSLMAEGYFEAAGRLVSSVIETCESADAMLYPICFLYRHYLELRLKEIILLGNAINTGRWETADGHVLNDLWEKAKTVLETKVGGTNVGELNTMQEQVLELSSIDRGGDEFRYPRTLERKNSPARNTLPSVTHVNLRHLKEVMEAMETVFCGSIAYLLEEVSPSREVRQSADSDESDAYEITVVVQSRNPAWESKL